MLQVEEIGSSARLQELRDAWCRLGDEAPGALLFQSYEWQMSWQSAFGGGWPQASLAFWQGDALVGLLPLLRDRRGQAWCAGSLTTPANAHGRRCGLLCSAPADEVLAALLGHLAQRAPPLRLGLRNEACGSALSRVLGQDLRALGLAACAAPATEEHFTRLEGAWESYLGSRSPQVRHELRRKARKLHGAGTVTLQTVSAPAELGQALTDMARIDERSWRAGTGTSLAREPAAGTFYSSLARRCAERGWLRLHLLRIDGEPFAYLFGVAFRSELYALRTAYDEGRRALSPGTAVIEHALHRAFDEGLAAFDFLGVDARWKRELATDTRALQHWCVHPRAALRCAVCTAYRLRAKPWLRQALPGLVAARRQWRGWPWARPSAPVAAP